VGCLVHGPAAGGLKTYPLLFIAEQHQQPSQGLLYKSRVRTEPTNITAPQFAAALWSRLESLVEEMAGCCIKVGHAYGLGCSRVDLCSRMKTKVYTLEKVLNVKKDPLTGVSFLDESMTVGIIIHVTVVA
jgi:hypothetical protein